MYLVLQLEVLVSCELNYWVACILWTLTALYWSLLLLGCLAKGWCSTTPKTLVDYHLAAQKPQGRDPPKNFQQPNQNFEVLPPRRLSFTTFRSGYLRGEINLNLKTSQNQAKGSSQVLQDSCRLPPQCNLDGGQKVEVLQYTVTQHVWRFWSPCPIPNLDWPLQVVKFVGTCVTQIGKLHFALKPSKCAFHSNLGNALFTLILKAHFVSEILNICLARKSWKCMCP